MAQNKSHFQILPLRKFDGASAAIKRPQEITSFSFDEQHKLRHDDSSLRWYWPPKLGADLSKGFETFVRHDDSVDEHINGLLAAIVKLEEKTGERVVADFVTWRGMMTKASSDIMCLPFDLQSSFDMNAIKFQNTIYIEESHIFKLFPQTHRTQSHQMQVGTFWGYKFETLSTLPAWWADCSRSKIESREYDIVNNKAQWCSIVKTGFDNTRIILGGEVDALWQGEPRSVDNPPVYVELKTSKEIRSDNDALVFEQKLLRFWAQSFLLGVQKIIIGFRDRNGVLQSVEELQTTNLPSITKKGGKTWDGNTCINFTNRLLKWLKEKLPEDGVVWKIKHDEFSENVDVYPVPGQESFLTKEFVEWRMSGNV
ncbi:RAI1-domain-containing protein [Terfezia boudieri ATCC MYA-4762]|uniref:Decapping nuclease n=1 Tax=Terfezia boudieri ATCC MYA-4762 TaxID=1051890 RepID=A0A3N4LXQ0_9PEZI|nr:RAI1-domain-containing protein [Terfezia boudieri ATCC MYA-4762]